MPTRFVNVAIAGWVYLAVVVNGRMILLHKSGRIGDCIRPGSATIH